MENNDELSPDLEAVLFFMQRVKYYRTKDGMWRNNAFDMILAAIERRVSGVYACELQTAWEYEELVRVAALYLSELPNKGKKVRLWLSVSGRVVEFLKVQPWKTDRKTKARDMISELFGRCLDMILSGKFPGNSN